MPPPHKSLVPTGNVVFDIANWARLLFHLMADGRVHPLVKLLPLGSLIYLLNPFDVPGPLDDAAVVGLGFYMFFEFCPPDVVNEHIERINQIIPGEWKPGQPTEPDDVIDADFHDLP